MNKLRNALTNTVVVFIMIVSVSAVLAVFVHSILFMPCLLYTSDAADE